MLTNIPGLELNFLMMMMCVYVHVNVCRYLCINYIYMYLMTPQVVLVV